MPGSFLELALSLSEHVGKAGVDHLAWRARQKSGLPTLDDALQQSGLAQTPAVPSRHRALPQAPDLDEALRRALGIPAEAMVAGPPLASPPPPRPEPTPPPEEPSYAEEFDIQETPVACWSCSQRHVNTVVVTGESGAASPSAEERREAAATLLGEVDVWLRYDVTAEKLARTDPRKRTAVEAAIPGMLAARTALQPPPADLHLAWSAAGEAERFLRRPTPSDLELQEAEIRMRDVQGWIGRADTLALPPEAAPHLTALREARHDLNRKGNTHATVLACRDALRSAAIALTPDPGHQALERAAEHARDARAAFYGSALSAMRQKRQAAVPSFRAKSPAVPIRRAYVDRDARLPEALAQAYLEEPADPGPSDIDAALGATAASQQAFARLAQLSRLRGVPVLDEPLPAEYALVDGEPEAVGVIEGAYVPTLGGVDDRIYAGPQSVVGSPRDVEMLLEEVAHSIMDSDACNAWNSLGKGIPYESMPEEREAKLASLLALVDTGQVVETRSGRPVDTRQVRLRVEELEKREDPAILRRARWTADIMARAIRGDVAGAAEASRGSCPR